MIGLDTGFFLELMNGNKEAVSLWKSGLDDAVEFTVSCISLFEIQHLGLKGKIRSADVILDSIDGMCQVVWLNPGVLSQGARLSHGLGMPAVASLILPSLLANGCIEIYTTDSHLEAYHGSNLTVKNLRRR
jgi:hypothetical protein